MINAILDGRKYPLPRSMNEMTLPQLEFLAELYENGTSPQAIKVKMLLFCIGATVTPQMELRINRKKKPIATDDITQVANVFDYLFTKPDKENNVYLNHTLTRMPYPKITLYGKQYTLPGDALTKATYHQWINLQVYDAARKHDNDYRYAFLSAIYTPKGKPFDSEKIDIEIFKHIDKKVATLTEWYWYGSSIFIADKFPRVFGGDGSEPTNMYEEQERILDWMTSGDAEKKRAYKADNLYNVLYSLRYFIELKEQEENQ